MHLTANPPAAKARARLRKFTLREFTGHRAGAVPMDVRPTSGGTIDRTGAGLPMTAH